MRTWIIFGGLFLLLTACGAMAEDRELVLPDAADLEEVTIAASELDLTVADRSFVAQLLESLRQSVKENTGEASVQDVPGRGAGLVRVDFGFKAGGTSTVFLYREGDRLLLEQPYQGIWELDGALEERLRGQIAMELGHMQTVKEA